MKDLMGMYSAIRDRLSAAIDEQQHFPFIMLTGPSDIGKRTLAIDVVTKKLGKSVSMDFLHIRDLSNTIDKIHAFPVRQPTGEAKSYQTADGCTYDNIGAREIRDRLSRSPHSQTKIVFIENIERATIAAANALLKHLEEPLPGRYIIATSSSPDDVLPTLHSRALIIQMRPIDEDEFIVSLTRKYDISQDQAQVVARLSAGKLRRAMLILENENYQKIVDDFHVLYEEIQNNQIIPIIQKLKKVEPAHRGRYRDALMQSAIVDGHTKVVDALIKHQKYRSQNVHAENSLTQLAMEMVYR